MESQNEYDVRGTVLATGYTGKHIRELLYAERIPGARKVAGKWLIPAASVDELRKRKRGELATA
jgi:hypothetical protein